MSIRENHCFVSSKHCCSKYFTLTVNPGIFVSLLKILHSLPKNNIKHV